MTAFYITRAAHGTTADERAGYAAGAQAGRQAAPEAKLPAAAGLHAMAEQSFAQRGVGEPMRWKSGFAHGYEDALKQKHRGP